MSGQHVDVRAERSRSQLIEGLRVQLHEHDPRDITVSSVCAQAGLSRPTFYQHFASLDDLAVAGIELRLAELSAVAEGSVEQRPTSYDAVVRFLDELDSDRGVYRQVIGNDAVFSGPRDAVEDWLVVRLVDDGPTEDASAVRFAAGGILSLVRGWLRQEPSDPQRPTSEQLADDLWRLASHVVGGPGTPAPPKLAP